MIWIQVGTYTRSTFTPAVFLPTSLLLLASNSPHRKISYNGKLRAGNFDNRQLYTPGIYLDREIPEWETVYRGFYTGKFPSPHHIYSAC